MKTQLTAIGFLLLVVSATTPVSGDEMVLTNKDIMRLTQVGLGAEVIITKIKISATAFDTSVEQLVALKEAGVEDSVIAAMVGKGVAADAGKPKEDEESFIITYPAQGASPATSPDTTAPASGATSQTAPAAAAAPAPGSGFCDTLSGGGEGPEMVVIPAGRFRMGCVSGQDCYDNEKTGARGGDCPAFRNIEV